MSDSKHASAGQDAFKDRGGKNAECRVSVTQDRGDQVTSWFLSPCRASQPVPSSSPPGSAASSLPSSCQSPALCRPGASRPHWIKKTQCAFIFNQFEKKTWILHQKCFSFVVDHRVILLFLADLYYLRKQSLKLGQCFHCYLSNSRTSLHILSDIDSIWPSAICLPVSTTSSR